ncbi:Acetylcholinesterase [Dactylella cylindrospora]|nr:Acetylcholinesterase [Dactylella cylindrospora]
MKLSTFILASFSLISSVTARVLEVGTDAGTIQGGSCSNTNSTHFLGVPYALPPVGELRWEAPLKYNGTFEGGSLNATTQPLVCHQFGPLLTEPGPFSEDCLYLNIYVPEEAISDSTSLPVKVFVHGGANSGGGISNPLYDGCNLSEDGAVVVTVAYRLGPLGFLALESAGIAGNFGIQDIILALQWVQENIGKFGGDRGKVLLFGQSAGAWNSFIISTLPNAVDLMNAVALESGGGVDFQTNASAQQAGAIFASQVNCSTTDATCLRNLEPEQLNNIYINLDNPGIGGFAISHPAMQPYIDGKVIPEQPSKVGVRVPAIFGYQGDDGTFFVLAAVQFDAAQATEDLLNAFLSYEFGPLADEVAAQYPAEAFAAHPQPVFARAAQITTDYAFKCPAYRGLTRAAQKGLPVWAYLFDHQSSCPPTAGVPDEYWDLLGAFHGSEVPYVFRNTEGFPLPNGTCNFDRLEQDTSQIMADAWTSVIINGEASVDGFPWPVFDNQTYQGLYVGQNITVIDSLETNFTICAFWDQINLLIRAAAETNSTNVTEEISPSLTSTETSLPTETESPSPTESQPSGGFRSFQAVGSFVIAVAVAGCVFLEAF